MKTSFYKSFVMLIAIAVVAACATVKPQKEASLYERLGGIEAISAVVNDFVEVVRADDRIKNPKVVHLMNTIDIAQSKAHLVDQVCMGAGGPCEYKGRTMKVSHKGLGITGDEFNWVVEDLIQTLDKYKVPEKEKQDLLAILGPMRGDIVEVQ
ncbi:MAG: group I truncated hemoglobin [Nitrospinales bacterium]